MEHLPIVIFIIVLSVYIAFVVFAKMSETFNEKMESRIKELIENSYWRNIFERDIYGNLKSWKTFNDFLFQERNRYRYEMDELSKWHHLMWKYGCYNPSEMEALIKDLIDKLNKA